MTKIPDQTISLYWQRIRDSFRGFLTILGVILFLAGVIGLAYIQDPIREADLDIRHEAAVPDGPVQIRSPQNKTTWEFQPGVARVIDLEINTGNAEIEHIQLVFNLIADNISPADLDIKLNPNINLKTVMQEVESTSDGLLVSLLATVNSQSFSQASFATNQTWQNLASIKFVPQTSGRIEASFDRELSIATHRMAPRRDLLRYVPFMSFEVGVDGDTEDRQRCEVQGGTWRLFSDGCVDSCAKAVDPNIGCILVMTWGCDCGSDQCWGDDGCQSIPIPTDPPPTDPPPTDEPIDPSQPVLECNDICTSNAQCPVNHRCFYTGQDYRCRLATNPSSQTCSPPSADPGFGQCNQSCGSNRDCALGLMCWQGACRHPENPSSLDCVPPTDTQRVAMTRSCNAVCQAHADCGINLMCYEGFCRLPTNPSSLSCSPATRASISPIYEQKGDPRDVPDEAEPLPPMLEPGIDDPDDLPSEDDLDPTEPDEDEIEDERPETALGALRNIIFGQDSFLPAILIGAGVLLFTIGVLHSRYSSKMGGRGKIETGSGSKMGSTNKAQGKTPQTSTPQGTTSMPPTPSPYSKPVRSGVKPQQNTQQN